jgi:hypothetical protein
MKYLILCFLGITIGHTVFAQKSIEITDIKKNSNDSHAGYYQGSLYLKYTSTAKAQKVVVIQINDMEKTEEYISGEAITKGYVYGQIVVGTDFSTELSIYNLKIKQETTGNFETPKGWAAGMPIVSYDKENDLYYIFILVSEVNYWTSPKKEIYQFKYDPATNEIEKSTIPSEQDGFTLDKILSVYVHNDKLICSGNKKGKAFAIYNLSTQKFQSIILNTKADNVYAETLLESEDGAVLGLHQANTTSQSIFYVHKILYHIDMESGETFLLGDYATLEGTNSLYGGITNIKRDRFFSNTLLYAPASWVTFSVSKEKFKLVKISPDELKVIDLEIGTPLSYSDVTDCYVQNGILYLKVNASGKIGGKKVQIEIDIEKETINESKEVSSTDNASRFFYTNEEGIDQYIEYEYDPKTGIKIYGPSN